MFSIEVTKLLGVEYLTKGLGGLGFLGLVLDSNGAKNTLSIRLSYLFFILA